jgi:hypothetical protein
MDFVLGYLAGAFVMWTLMYYIYSEKIKKK